jgi:hypothetical protein
VPFVYHDGCAVHRGRYLWRGRDCRNGEPLADFEALVLRLLATTAAHLRVTVCSYRIDSPVGAGSRVGFSALVERFRTKPRAVGGKRL